MLLFLFCIVSAAMYGLLQLLDCCCCLCLACAFLLPPLMLCTPYDFALLRACLSVVWLQVTNDEKTEFKARMLRVGTLDNTNGIISLKNQ
jgi:hypothetical protein